MSGLFSSPSAPDPVATANAQAAANSQAAQTSAQYNMIDQVTPYGNLSYTQSGTYPDGTPKYTATQTLNPTQTQTLANQDQLSQNVTGLGLNYTNQLANISNTPFDASSLGTAPTGDQQYVDSATNALYNQYSSRLDNQYGQQSNALDQKLYNQGISQGSDAWNQAMTNFSQDKNDAYQSALNQSVAGGSQAATNQYNMQSNAYQNNLSNALTIRDQPINELAALLGTSSGVTNPTLTSTPQSNVAPADISGLIQNNYAQKVGQKNAQLGALGQIAGAGTAAAVSDRRLKTRITKIGKTRGGLSLYRFAYLGTPEIMHTGVMAQEVIKKIPEAIITMPNGFMAVNYDMIAI